MSTRKEAIADLQLRIREARKVISVWAARFVEDPHDRLGWMSEPSAAASCLRHAPDVVSALRRSQAQVPTAFVLNHVETQLRTMARHGAPRSTGVLAGAQWGADLAEHAKTIETLRAIQ